MKKLITVLLSLICVFVFVGCDNKSETTSETTQSNWQDDFSYFCKYIPADNPDDFESPVDFILNGHPAHCEITIRNTSSTKIESAYVWFLIIPETSTEFELQGQFSPYYLGNLDSTESGTITLYEFEVTDEMEALGMDTSQRWIIRISRIEYNKK